MNENTQNTPKQPSTGIQKKSDQLPQKEGKSYLSPVKGSIKAILKSNEFIEALRDTLPKSMSPERMARIAVNCLAKVPKLAKCEQASFFNCLLTLSQYGIEPDGRQAHLIPFENRKKGTVECQLIIDYKGYVELLKRSGKVARIHADIICKNDVFDFDMGEVKSHKINIFEPRGEVVGAWAGIWEKDGSTKFEVMSKQQIEGIRTRSRSSDSGPWATDWEEMAKKTVFKRLCKWVSLSPSLRDLMKVEDEQEFEGDIIEQEQEKPQPRAIGSRRKTSASKLLSRPVEPPKPVEVEEKEEEEYEDELEGIL